MTCGEDALKAAKAIVKKRKVKEFTIKEVREYMIDCGTKFTENSIRGQIVAYCNADNPKHKYAYFKKVKDKRATYKLA